MKIKKIVGGVAAMGLTAGMLAFSSAPAEAVVRNVGSCTGMLGIMSFKSSVINPDTGKAFGMTNTDDKDVAISGKGVPQTVGGTNFGSCTFVAGRSTPDGGKPLVKGYNGTKSITKWGIKLSSPEADCLTSDSTDATEWPLNGSLSIDLADGKKLSAAISVSGFTDPDNDPETPSDVVSGRGLVTKGVAAGADVTTEVFFDPVYKNKDPEITNFYGDYAGDIGGALGCTSPAIPANILNGLIGDGTSYFLGLPASGISFTIGTAD